MHRLDKMKKVKMGNNFQYGSNWYMYSLVGDMSIQLAIGQA